MTKRVFLIDGHSLLHRAFWALPSLTTAEGEHTNAVYGFTRMLFRLMDQYNPDSIFVAFDVSAPTFRHREYEEYKATRKEMPEELRPQVTLLKEVLDAFGITRLELEGYEADDVIGTAARLAEQEGVCAWIVTGDRDSLQLVSDKTCVLLTKKGIQETEKVDLEHLKQEYKLNPEQIPELKALMGDSSDNIPGVPGIGEKTAMKLLQEHPSLDAIYENIDKQKGKLKERLAENKDQAYLSRSLAQIDCSVPLDIDIQSGMAMDLQQLKQLFTRLEFRTLLAKLETLSSHDSADETPDQAPITDLCSVDDGAVKALQSFLAADHCFSATVRSDGEGPDRICTDLLLSASEKAYHLTTDSPKQAWDAVRSRLDSDAAVTAVDAKQLFRALMPQGIRPTIQVDTVLAGYVLDPAGDLSLDGISQRYGDLPPLSEVVSLENRLAAEAARAHALAPVLEQTLKTSDMWELYHDMEIPLAAILTDMEYYGILVDPDHLETLSHNMEKKLQELTDTIYDMAGEEFNINSTKQLGRILFEKLELPVIKRTKTGPSTDAEVLEQLSDHPIVAHILAYRQQSKLKSTYADALGELIHPKTGRIHTTFNQTITATGRLSSTNPNLQNIPIRTEAGRSIRKAFVAPEGFVLMAADYSQIELRVLAHMAGDEKMLDAFKQGLDIHTQTAAEVMGINRSEVTKEQRSAAKAVNFGIVYGISAFGLARNTNMPQEKAQQYIDQYFSRYPKVKEYMDWAVAHAREQGYVTTLFHRRRYVPDIKARNFARRSFAERTAMNTPVQGSAADIIKLAMIRVQNALDSEGLESRLLLQVHDELVLEVPSSETEQCVALLRREMENAVKLSVPLNVDIQTGPNWKDMEPHKE